MTLALTILYLVISGVIYAYLGKRWEKELKDDFTFFSMSRSADYRSAQIFIAILWLPIVILCVFLSPAYLGYKVTILLIESSNEN